MRLYPCSDVCAVLLDVMQNNAEHKGKGLKRNAKLKLSKTVASDKIKNGLQAAGGGKRQAGRGVVIISSHVFD